MCGKNILKRPTNFDPREHSQFHYDSKVNPMKKQFKQNSKEKTKRSVKIDRASLSRRILDLMLIALIVTLVVEGFNQGDVSRMLRYLTHRTMYFLLNYLVILTTLSLSTLFKHRKAVSLCVAIVWVALGFVNFLVCRNRTQPLVSGDLIVTPEIFGMITLYFSWPQIIAMFGAGFLLIVALVFFFRRSAKLAKVSYIRSVVIIATLVALLVGVRLVGIQTDTIPRFFGDRVNAYHDYGFSTCFSFTFASKGITKPTDYSEEIVEEILDEIEEPQATAVAPRFTAEETSTPNIVFIQLESIFDVDTVIGAEFSEYPMPFYKKLMEENPSALLYVPTIGGGTANVEFEVMSGFNMDFFGAGEAPYNTIIPNTTCETIANILREHGYYCSALHNNTGAFFNRYQVYANLGYDRFDCLEYMLYPKYNKVGWAHDTILADDIMQIMSGSQERDLIFAIGVESHGKYPETYEYSEGDIEVLSLPEGAYLAPFQNYVNVIDEVDDFVEQIITALDAYDEPTVVILYGDHLPALGLEAEMLTTGDLYASKYVIWNNYGAEFEAVDMQAYRLSSELLRQLGLSGGILPKLHQSYPIDEEGDEYLTKLQTLEYDLLYGKREAYGEAGPYAPTALKLGVNEIKIERAEIEYGRMLVTGENFTEFSKVICNGTAHNTLFIDDKHIAIAIGEEMVFDRFCVAQINSDGKEMGRTEDFVL